MTDAPSDTRRTPPPLVSVRGEASHEVEPELARLWVTVTARGRKRDEVLQALDERVRTIDGVLDGFESAIDRVETEAVRVNPQIDPNKAREKITGYVGSVRKNVVVSEFSGLGELIARLADHDLTEVGGPWWSLRPDSDAYRDARVAAVQDAVRRAREYAGAVGADLTELVELADTALLTEGGPAPRQFAALPAAAPASAQAARGGAPESFTFDVEPAKQYVHASVEARFHISPPNLD